MKKKDGLDGIEKFMEKIGKKGELTEEGEIELLKVTFGFSKEEAVKWIKAKRKEKERKRQTEKLIEAEEKLVERYRQLDIPEWLVLEKMVHISKTKELIKGEYEKRWIA